MGTDGESAFQTQLAVSWHKILLCKPSVQQQIELAPTKTTMQVITLFKLAEKWENIA